MFSLLNDNEIFMDIEGYEGLYSVSNYGRVYSHQLGGRILKPGRGDKGYLQVGLWKDNIKKTIRVHALVGNAFVGKREQGMTFDHIDRNKLNNKASNIRLATKSEQTINQKLRCTNKSGEKNIIVIKNSYRIEISRNGKICRRCLRLDKFSLADAVKVRDKMLADLN